MLPMTCNILHHRQTNTTNNQKSSEPKARELSLFNNDDNIDGGGWKASEPPGEGAVEADDCEVVGNIDNNCIVGGGGHFVENSNFRSDFGALSS